MDSERIILCGGLKAKGTGAAPGLKLNAWPVAGRTNVRLDILDLNQKFCSTVPGRFYDLLDIATYCSVRGITYILLDSSLLWR